MVWVVSLETGITYCIGIRNKRGPEDRHTLTYFNHHLQYLSHSESQRPVSWDSIQCVDGPIRTDDPTERFCVKALHKMNGDMYLAWRATIISLGSDYVEIIGVGYHTPFTNPNHTHNLTPIDIANNTLRQV